MAYLPIVQQKKITLTSAQVKALNAAPVVAIAAPGVGKVINVINAITKLNYGSNAFNSGAGQTINLYYNNNVENISQIFSNPSISSSSNKFDLRTVSYNLGNLSAGSIDNVNVAIHNPISTEIGGNASNDSTISIVINYIISTI